MPELLHPGVYVQEIPSAVRPIEGVSTSTAAFIGVTDKGPLPGKTLPTGRPARPVLVTSFTEYQRQFGGFRRDSFLSYAAKAFFDNGGQRLYIARVAGAGVTKATSAPLQFDAAFPGPWASQLAITLGNASGGDPNKFDVIVNARGQSGLVQLEEFTDLTVSGAQAAIAAGKFIRLTHPPTKRPGNCPELRFANGVSASDAAAATAATSAGVHHIDLRVKYPGSWPLAANGNLTATVTDPTDAGTAATQFDFIVKLNGHEVEHFRNLTFKSSDPAPANYGRNVINSRSQYVTVTADFTDRPENSAGDVAFLGGSDGTGSSSATAVILASAALNEGAWGNAISVAIDSSSDTDANNFKLLVALNGTVVETFDNLTYSGSPNLLPTATNPADYGWIVVNSRSEYLALTSDFTLRPSNTGGLVALSGGQDGAAVGNSDYLGAPAANSTVTGTGLHALDQLTDVNLIAIPGQGDPEIVKAGMEYCKTRLLQDCFFIGDMGTVTSVDSARRDGATPDVITVQDARDFATTGFGGVTLDKAAGDYGAVYFPWVWSVDPIGTGRNPRILLPPSGFLAGIYSRIDNSRGVFKAPAGTEAGVFGALATAIVVGDTEQDQLNPIMVNVIRTVPGSGIVVWGTRTIGSDASYRYIPVRRMAIFLRVSIYYGIQWAVFEPNDEPLWAALRLNIRAFMLTQFRAGAFQGSKPDDAFFVKCDSSTTTQQDIDNGVVNILVGFAPLKPAEFVVLKLSQKVNQPAA